MNKRGQIPESLLYVAAGIITAIVVYYGVSSVISFKSKEKEAETILLKQKISTDIARISSQLGAARNYSYLLPSQFDEICYVDTSKKEEIIENISKIVNSETSIKNKEAIIEIINNSIYTNSSNNVFLFGKSTDAFRGGDLEICSKPIKCFQAYRGKLSVEMFGGGGFALLEPCTPIINLPPIVLNETAAKMIFFVGEGEKFPFISEDKIRANATDPEKGNLEVFWFITDPYGETKKEQKEAEKNAPSPVRTNISLQTTSYGTYKLSVIATDYERKSASTQFNFIIKVARPDNLPPEALIIKPTEYNFNVVQEIEFEGIGNDSERGELYYEWDFGDGYKENGNSGEREANIHFKNTTKHKYTKPGQYKIVFTVKDNSLSASDTITINVGNTPPVVEMLHPYNNEVLFSEDVNFSFVPSDNEQNILKCLIIVDGEQINLGETESGKEKYFLKKKIVEGTHLWSAVCSDGITTNEIRTHRFEIKIPPVLKCIVSSDCASLKEIFSISSLTNAHASTDPNYYNYKVCCNLTKGEEIINLDTSRGTKILSLYSSANSHVESPTVAIPTYTIPIYIGAEQQDINIICRASDKCENTETCVIALSSQQNAHLSDCSSTYPLKICCNASQ